MALTTAACKGDITCQRQVGGQGYWGWGYQPNIHAIISEIPDSRPEFRKPRSMASQTLPLSASAKAAQHLVCWCLWSDCETMHMSHFLQLKGIFQVWCSPASLFVSTDTKLSMLSHNIQPAKSGASWKKTFTKLNWQMLAELSLNEMSVMTGCGQILPTIDSLAIIA